LGLVSSHFNASSIVFTCLSRGILAQPPSAHFHTRRGRNSQALSYVAATKKPKKV
jgi:hypothetical protein